MYTTHGRPAGRPCSPCCTGVYPWPEGYRYPAGDGRVPTNPQIYSNRGPRGPLHLGSGDPRVQPYPGISWRGTHENAIGHWGGLQAVSLETAKYLLLCSLNPAAFTINTSNRRPRGRLQLAAGRPAFEYSNRSRAVLHKTGNRGPRGPLQSGRGRPDTRGETQGFWPKGQKLAGISPFGTVTARRQHGPTCSETAELHKTLLIQQAFAPFSRFLTG